MRTRVATVVGSALLLTTTLVLAQSAFDPNDAFSPIAKTYRLAALAQALYAAGLAALDKGTAIDRLDLGPARQALASVRRAPPAEFEARATEAAVVIARIAA